MWRTRARAILDLMTGATYATGKAAAAVIGCTPARVSQVLHGRAPAAKGHRLRWADDTPHAAPVEIVPATKPRPCDRGAFDVGMRF